MPYHYDDGTEFNPEDIPVPELCKKCRMFNIQDGDEEILCNLTRADQNGASDFICYGYRPADGRSTGNPDLTTKLVK